MPEHMTKKLLSKHLKSLFAEVQNVRQERQGICGQLLKIKGRVATLAFATVILWSPAQAQTPVEKLGKIIAPDYAEALLEAAGKNSADHFKYCCRYMRGGDRRDLVPFDLEDGWFAEAWINRRGLVAVEMDGTCSGFFGGARDCTAEEIDKELEKREAAYSGMPGWYGKYHNRLLAYRSGELLPQTDWRLKQDMTFLSRENGIDHVLIGPMVYEPDELFLVMNTNGVRYDLLDE